MLDKDEFQFYKKEKLMNVFKWGTMRFGCLLLALDSITAVKLTNDFILKFWPNVTSSDVDRIAQTNGFINKETGSKITK